MLNLSITRPPVDGNNELLPALNYSIAMLTPTNASAPFPLPPGPALLIIILRAGAGRCYGGKFGGQGPYGPCRGRPAGRPYSNNAFTRPREAGVTAGSLRLKYWMRLLAMSVA